MGTILKNNIRGKAFAKHLPSAFIVASPFQLLCAIEAIHEFEINDYKIVLILLENCPRNEQLVAMAKASHLDYEVLYLDTLANELFDDKKNQFKIDCKGKYDRVFVGDNRYADKYYPIPLYAKKGALVVYLDDGNASIMVLNGCMDDEKPKNWRKRLNWWKNRRKKKIDAIIRDLNRMGLVDTRCFYTIYSDIKSHYYETHPNTFKHLLATNSSMKKRDVVIIIGGIIDVLACMYDIKVSHMEAITWMKLTELRNEFPKEKIIYVPHGRDINKIIPRYCDILNIEYKRLDETIETYCVNESFNPIAIRGFMSTAQSTLKIIYPYADARFWKIRFNTTKFWNKSSDTITAYYMRRGIIEETIWINPQSQKNINSIINNITSLVKLVKDRMQRKQKK